jgi:hypothetical protein
MTLPNSRYEIVLTFEINGDFMVVVNWEFNTVGNEIK